MYKWIRDGISAMLQRVLRFLDPLILSMSYKELPPNLDEYSENDALNAWTALSPLLRRRKIWLFDSEEYNNYPPPPHKEPSDPFRVMDDENFLFFPPGVTTRRTPFYWTHVSTLLYPVHEMTLTIS